MSIEIKRKVTGFGYRWHASYRPPESERVVLHGTAWTERGAKRVANRAQLRLVRAAHGATASADR